MDDHEKQLLGTICIALLKQRNEKPEEETPESRAYRQTPEYWAMVRRSDNRLFWFWVLVALGFIGMVIFIIWQGSIDSPPSF